MNDDAKLMAMIAAAVIVVSVMVAAFVGTHWGSWWGTVAGCLMAAASLACGAETVRLVGQHVEPD